MITDILKLSLKELNVLIQTGQVSPLTLTLECLNQIKQHKYLNTFITVDDDASMNSAKYSADMIINKTSRALEGIPVAVKDLFLTKGIKTTAASAILQNFIPTYESTVTEKLLNNGAIMIGKTNMDEFAMGSSNETSYFGPVRNPWNARYVPGGSSGGSAAAVASYMCYAALGSDTGGSVRQPASFCGVVGFKPSYGRCSRFGMIAYSSSLDQAGVIARSVDDACIVLESIMGQCDKDSTTVNASVPKLSGIVGSVRGKKIGYVSAHMQLVNSSVKDMWQRALDLLREYGANIVEISLNDLDTTTNNPIEKWMATYYVLTPVEAFSNLSRYDGIRYGSYVSGNNLDAAYKNTRNQFGDEVKRRIMLGADILSMDHENRLYNNALEYRKIIQSNFKHIFDKVDVILSPTSPHEAFEFGTDKSSTDMYAEDAFTIIANLLKAPAISIPACLGEHKLPIGLQLMSAPFEEVKMIEVAKFLEAQLQFKGLNEVSNEL